MLNAQHNEHSFMFCSIIIIYISFSLLQKSRFGLQTYQRIGHVDDYLFWHVSLSLNFYLYKQVI